MTVGFAEQVLKIVITGMRIHRDKVIIYRQIDYVTMTYSIPSDDQIADAVFAVMYRNAQVTSQNEMVRLVTNELNKRGGEFRISGERIRRVALNRDILQITIDYNKRDGELPSVCPVCRNEMSKVMNMTLDGDAIEVSRKCTVCPYTVGTKNRVPGRYTFTRKKR